MFTPLPFGDAVPYRVMRLRSGDQWMVIGNYEDDQHRAIWYRSADGKPWIIQPASVDVPTLAEEGGDGR